MGWFNVLMTEFIVVSGRKDGVDLSPFRSAIWIRKRSYFASNKGLPV